MLKKKNIALLLLLSLICMICFVGCNGSSDDTSTQGTEATDATVANNEGSEDTFTKEQMNEEISNKVLAIAKTSALLLNGTLGDSIEKVATEKSRDIPEYATVEKTLGDIIKASGATYAYTLIQSPENPDIALYVADYGEDAEPLFGELKLREEGNTDELKKDGKYIEVQIYKAFEGTPTAAVHTWSNSDDGKSDWHKSAFAPILNSEGKQIGILGIDYPADELGFVDGLYELN